MTDQGFNLRSRPFNVTVAWNVMPRVGVLYTRTKTFTGASGRGAQAGRTGHLWKRLGRASAAMGCSASVGPDAGASRAQAQTVHF